MIVTAIVATMPALVVAVASVSMFLVDASIFMVFCRAKQSILKRRRTPLRVRQMKTMYRNLNKMSKLSQSLVNRLNLAQASWLQGTPRQSPGPSPAPGEQRQLAKVKSRKPLSSRQKIIPTSSHIRRCCKALGTTQTSWQRRASTSF